MFSPVPFLLALALFLTGFLAAPLPATAAEAKPEEGRRLEVLFLGDRGHHNPIERFAIIAKALGRRGINFTYTEKTSDLNPANLEKFDTVLLYANLQAIKPEEENALHDYIRGGGGFAPIHCASACFGHSDAFIRLVGARFKSHGEGVFTARIVDPEHPVMKGFQPFETWDETYVHDRHNEENRHVLMMREEEPWTWVRHEGRGRVFYTAHGHDERCWNLEGFQDLIYRGLVWSAGDGAAAALSALRLPELVFDELPIANYQTRQPTTKVHRPLPPAESMKLVQTPPDLALKLFSAEPDVYNPLAITWDERGRTFVSVTTDYPNELQPSNSGRDRILLCHDADGDGKAEKTTVFADKLSIPTAILWTRGGIIAVDSDQVVFLKDTNGDDVADERKVLFGGIGTWDTHAGTSGFTLGYDNWIYATSGYAGFQGKVGEKDHKFGMGVYRFRPDGSALEFLQATTNNTWGIGLTETGEVMGSTANGNPSWYHTVPNRYLDAAGIKTGPTPRADNDWRAYPITFDVRQVDWFLGYSAAAGHRLYTARDLPDRFWNQSAFVCEPTAHVVAAARVRRDGSRFSTDFRAPEHVFASADGWSSPVAAEVGPDGAVWILDWYNCIIQHNPTPNVASAGIDSTTGKGKAYENPHRHNQLGRIYRVVNKARPHAPMPRLDPADPDSLLAALGHPNLFWRQQAQRLLVERAQSDVWPALVNLARHAPADELGHRPAALHALGTLEGLGAFQSGAWAESFLGGLLDDPCPGVRRFALRFLPRGSAMVAPVVAMLERETDADLAKEGLLALADLPADPDLGRRLLALARIRPLVAFPEPAVAQAFTVAATRHATGVLLAAIDPETPGSIASNLLPPPGARAWTAPAGAPPLASGREGKPAMAATLDQPGEAAWTTVVDVTPGQVYRLGGWIQTSKVEGAGEGAFIALAELPVRSPAIKGDRDWTYVETEFDAGDRRQVQVLAKLGQGGPLTGTARWDGLFLRPVGLTDTPVFFRQLARQVPEGAQRTVLSTAFEKSSLPMAVDLLRAMKEPGAVAKRERVHPIDPRLHARGEGIYERTCLACHQADGQGLAPGFPPIDGSPFITGDVERLVRIVHGGLSGKIEVLGQTYDGIMPGHTELNDEDMAAVLTYVRQSWSNDASAITPAQVKPIRESMKDRTMPWSVEELGK